MLKNLKKIGSNIFLVISLIFICCAVLMAMGYTNNITMKQREKLYVQGQYDAIYGHINLTRIVKNGEHVDAYAKGFDDAYDGEIKIKALTDSTFIFTSSPWKKGGIIPTDVIKIE